MVTASAGRGDGADGDLAGAVDQVLATLTDVSGDTSAAELGDRLTLVRWLRSELAAVETLLTGVYGRRTANMASGPDRAG